MAGQASLGHREPPQTLTFLSPPTHLQGLLAPRIWHCHATPLGPAAGQCYHRYGLPLFGPHSPSEQRNGEVALLSGEEEEGSVLCVSVCVCEGSFPSGR